MLHTFDELLTQIALAPPCEISHDSQENKSRVASFLPIQTGISIGFRVSCELDRGGRTPRPVSTGSAQAILVDACDLHESARKGCKNRGDPSGNEEYDRNRHADPFAPQATEPRVGLPVFLVVGGFEMAPS